MAVIVALAAFVTAPGHAAVGEGEIVTNKFHQLVYLCEVERDDSATFSKFDSLPGKPDVDPEISAQQPAAAAWRKLTA